MRFWRENKVLVLSFVLVLGLTVFFGLGALKHLRGWDAAVDPPIEGWMTPRYVAHSWNVPRAVMEGDLGLIRGVDGPVPLSRIAEARGVPVEVLVAEIEAAIAAHRAAIAQ